MINRPDSLTAFFNNYMESGLYCYWSEEDKQIIIIIADLQDEEVDSFDLENFENE